MAIGKIVITGTGLCSALIDRNTMISFPDAPDYIHCPRCGLLIPDFDGFGFVAHCGDVKNFPPPCGYCTHPSSDCDSDGNWVCGICGAVEGSQQWSDAKETRES